jgi:hypothetical protein
MSNGNGPGWTEANKVTFLEQQAALVQEHGFAIVNVFGGGSGFSYTQGFRTFDHPDILLFGIGPDAGNEILWNVFNRVKAGEHFEPGQRYAGIFAGFDAAFVPVHHTNRLQMCKVTEALYKTGEFDVLQLVYPDRNGKFPWEADVDPAFRRSLALFDKPYMSEPPGPFKNWIDEVKALLERRGLVLLDFGDFDWEGKYGCHATYSPHEAVLEALAETDDDERAPDSGVVQITIQNVAGEQLYDRLETLVQMLNDRESIDLTLLVNGDIRDIALLYEPSIPTREGYWRYEVKDYSDMMTLDEALRNPDAFVEGMTETSGEHPLPPELKRGEDIPETD